jgi:solute:Na+ symporter, SSS family
VHDFYRRFLKPSESEKHYVRAGRIATVLLFVLSSALVFGLQNAQQNFNIILQVGAGTGLLYLLRWFWWRINAWCEIVAMSSSFLISLLFLVWSKHGMAPTSDQQLLITVVLTTILWVVTAYVGPQTDDQTLIDFYRKVHPFGPGWRRVRLMAGIPDSEAAEWAKTDNIPLAMLGWVSGTALIWGALFTLGNFLYGRMTYAYILLAVSIVSGTVLLRVIKRLWN